EPVSADGLLNAGHGQVEVWYAGKPGRAQAERAHVDRALVRVRLLAHASDAAFAVAARVCGVQGVASLRAVNDLRRCWTSAAGRALDSRRLGHRRLRNATVRAG